MRTLYQEESFYALRLLAGFPDAASAAAWLRVSTRQVRRWQRGDSRPPHSVLLALRYRGGDLGTLSAPWAGWILWNGALWAPGVRWSEGLQPGELLALPWLLQLQDAVISGTSPPGRPS